MKNNEILVQEQVHKYYKSDDERLYVINSNLNAIISKYKNNPCFNYVRNKINLLLKTTIDSITNNDSNEMNYRLYSNFETIIVQLLNQIKEKMNKISYLYNQVYKIPNLKMKVMYISKVKNLEKNLNSSSFDDRYNQLSKEIEYIIKQAYINLLKESLIIKFEEYFTELDLVKDNKNIRQALKVFDYAIKICNSYPEKIKDLMMLSFSDYDYDIQIINSILNEKSIVEQKNIEIEQPVQISAKNEQLSESNIDEQKDNKNESNLFVRTDKFISSNNIVKLIEDDGKNVRIAYRCHSAIVEDTISKELFKKHYVSFRNYFDSAKFVGKMTSDNRLLLYTGGVLGIQYIKDSNKFMALPKAYAERCIGEEVIKDNRELYYKLITEYFSQSIDENKVNFSYDNSGKQKKH